MLRISVNEGVSWKYNLLVDYNPTGTKGDYTAYSDLVHINKKELGVLYERIGYKEIVYQPIALKKNYQPWKK